VRRKSKLGVLVRLARLEESKHLREFGRVRADVQQLEGYIEEVAKKLTKSGNASWMDTHIRSEPGQLRQVDQYRAHLTTVLEQLHTKRSETLGKLEHRRRDLTAARLRTRALEHASERRDNELRRSRLKREERHLEELNRTQAIEVRHESD